MSNEYYAVILEFSSREIKLGLVGESSEHVLITCDSPLWKKLVPRNTLGSGLPAFLQVDSHSIPIELRTEIIDSLNSKDLFKDLLDAFERDLADSKWFDWQQDGYLTLSTMVKTLLLDKLLVTPMKTKLFVLDCAMSAASKSSLCKTLFATRTAVLVAFLPYSPCCCMGAGVETALVVSLGWNSCTVTPVVDLRSLLQKDLVQFSGESMHYSPAIHHATKSFDDVEEEISHSEKFMEVALFSKSGLPAALSAFVKSLPLDSRASIVANLIFTGQRSNAPGVKGRLLTEIATYLPGYEVSGKQCLGAWAGASLYCSTTLLKEKGVNWKHMQINRLSFDKTPPSVLEEYHF